MHTTTVGRLIAVLTLGSALLGVAALGSADQLSDRQVLVVFSPGTIAMADELDVGDVAQVVSLESGLGQVLTNYGIQVIARAFPDFNRADTLGVGYTGEPVRLTDWSNVFLLTAAQASDVEPLIADLQSNGSAVIAEPNGTGIGFSVPTYPNDPLLTSGGQRGLWAPAQSGAPDGDVNAPWAWGITTGDPGANPHVNVGVIDGGFTFHPDLGSRVLNTNGESGRSNHAYHVAGIIGALTNNGIGIAGVNWVCGLKSWIGGYKESDLTTVNAVNVLSPPNLGNCRVLNASWGLVTANLEYPRKSTFVEAAFKDHFGRTGVTVAAMGNRGLGGLRDYPANFQYGIISVGASDSMNTRWSGSSTSPQIDLVAPGVDIWTTDSTGAYARDTGTSFAAAFVSGAASLLFTKYPTLGADDVENILRYTAQDVGPANKLPADLDFPQPTNYPPSPMDTLTGAGRLDIERALRFLDSPNRLEQLAVFVPGALVTIGTEVGLAGLTAVFGVPGLPDNNYSGIEAYPVSCTLTFAQSGIANFATPPLMWGSSRGQFTSGWLDYTAIGTSAERLITDYRHCYVTGVTTTGYTVHSWIYFIPGEGYFPVSPSQTFAFATTAVGVAQVPDPSASYFVPRSGLALHNDVVEGQDAVRYFRACPNNDDEGCLMLSQSPRIRIVVRDSNGAPIAGIQSTEIYALLNGGPAAQGLYGDGADSVVANTDVNSAPTCPNVRVITANTATDANGQTFITFGGYNTGSGDGETGARDPLRKWGHYDGEIPVFVRGVQIRGKLTEADPLDGYKLRIKNLDWYGGLGPTANVGEAVTMQDFNGVSAFLNVNNAISYWKDFDSSGSVTSTDFNLINRHVMDNCGVPNAN
jgi:hypothetical protein